MYLLPLAPGVCLALLLGSYVIRPLAFEVLKGSTYECGFIPVEGQTYSPFTVTFFVVGLLFLLFDLELLFIFPLVISPDIQMAWASRGAILFFTFLVISLIYELGAGVLRSFVEA